jgi:hypothetical protein
MGEQLLLVVLQGLEADRLHLAQPAGVCEADEVAEIALPALDGRAGVVVHLHPQHVLPGVVLDGRHDTPPFETADGETMTGPAPVASPSPEIGHPPRWSVAPDGQRCQFNAHRRRRIR